MQVAYFIRVAYTDLQTYWGWGSMAAIATEHNLTKFKPKMFAVSHVHRFMRTASEEELQLLQRVTENIAGK